MKLTIIYDDRKKSETDLIPDHGFSCYIETNQEVLLFDTGTDGNILLHNMKILKKNPESINKIIISHEHYDHNGGLATILSVIKHATVYRLANELSTETITNIYVDHPLRIADSVYSTGRLSGIPRDEQSLILKGTQGFFVLTGCSHSGIESILKKAGEYGNIIGVIGGFHGCKDFFVMQSLQYIYPCHCTKHKETIKQLYPDRYYPCYIGLSIII